MRPSICFRLLFILFFNLLIANSCKKGEEPIPDKQGVSGKVLDDKTKKPLDGVDITLKDASITIKGDKTTSDGLYSLKAIKAGTYTVYSEKKGYVPKSSKVTIVPNEESRNNDFSLKPVYEILPESGLNFGADDTKKTLELKNNLDQSLSFSITTGNKWFSIDPLSGNIPRNENSVFLDITLNRTGLTPGSYRGSINISFGEFGGETYNITFDVPNNDAPTVSSDKPTGQTKTSAEISGTIISIGKGPVTNYGHVWGETPTPECCNPGFYTDFKAKDKPGAFTSILASLTPGKTYFVRAYARNQSGINYSYKEEYSFTTPTTPTPPWISMGDISLITPTTARAVGKILSNGGDPIIEYGHVWSKTDPTPEPSSMGGPNQTNFKGEPSSVEFISNIQNLDPKSQYYIRAYAKNSTTINYGKSGVVSFNTPEPITQAKITTAAASDVNETTATLNGNLTEYGSLQILEHGFVWSRTNADPKLNAKGCDYKSLGNLPKSQSPFSTTVSGLRIGTTYYYRAYVKSEGSQEVYGAVTRIFVTKETGRVVHYTFNGSAEDMSGNGNNANSNAQLTIDRFLNPNSAYDLSKGTIQMINPAIADFTGELTFSLWVKVAEGNFAGGRKILFGKDSDWYCNDNYKGFFVMIDSKDPTKLVFWYKQGGAKENSVPICDKEDIADGEWHHLVISKAARNLLFYLDGVSLRDQPSVVDYDNIISGLYPISVGNMLRSNGCWFGSPFSQMNAQIDDFRIYYSAFSASRVKELYNREKP